ncbi:MAG: hypothetical protein NVS1B4_06000 [Gemmatimonadaceae bacterium]
MSRRTTVVAVAITLALLLVIGRGLAAVYVDHAWYEAMGAGPLWVSKAWIVIAVRVGSGLTTISFVFVNLYAVRHSIVSVVVPRRVANLEIGEEVPGRYLMGAVIVASVLIGAVLTIPGATWPQFALALAGAPFGESDPYFQLDISFFLYWLPVETLLYTWALVATLTVTTLVLVLYGVTPSLRWERGHLVVSTYVRRHLSVLGGLLLALLAWSYRLDAFALLGTGSGAGGAFTYADHRVGIPATLVLSLVCIAAAVIVCWSGWTGLVRLAITSVVGVLLLSVVVHQWAPTLARRLDRRDPTVRERPYEATRAAYTQRAFGADRVSVGPVGVGIASLHAVATNASGWDPAALERAMTRSETAPLSPSAPVGWSASEEGLLAVVPQRLVSRGSSDRVTWAIGRALAGRADDRGGIVRVNALGQPDADDAPIITPFVNDSLYATPFMVVADSGARIAGVRLDGEVSRLAHAWTLQNFRIVLGDLPRPTPTMLLYLGVRERVKRLAPVFAQGSAVFPIMSGDTLYWSLDLYSSATTFPLSQHASLAGEERAYFRHAATAVINSVTGRVALVADVFQDSLAAHWRRRYPALFRDAESLDGPLRSGLLPPLDGLRGQTLAFATYGSGGAPVSRRHAPWTDGSDTGMARPTVAPFLISAGHRGRLASAIPLLDDAERVIGVVLAIGGGDGTARWLPLAGPTPRWPIALQLLRTPADTTSVARDDGTALRGPARVLPVAGGAIVVQSSYAVRATGVTLARVALVTGDSLRAARTLDEAASVPSKVEAHAADPLSYEETRARAAAMYEIMRTALRRGDWVAFGRAFQQLGAVLGASRP